MVSESQTDADIGIYDSYDTELSNRLLEYTIDILCLMALADAFGFEYGEFVN